MYDAAFFKMKRRRLAERENPTQPKPERQPEQSLTIPKSGAPASERKRKEKRSVRRGVFVNHAQRLPECAKRTQAKAEHERGAELDSAKEHSPTIID